MKTDIIKIDSKLNGSMQALEETEKFAVYNNISGKDSMHIRLIVEDTLSMMHGIMDDYSGLFWIESEKSDKRIFCRICISVPNAVDCDQELHLMDISSSGKNMNAKGFTGKIREFVRMTAQPLPKKSRNIQRPLMSSWWNLGTNTSAGAVYDNSWSLGIYRENILANKEENTQEWDELEKSIIAKLADEVKVWLKENTTEIIVEKLLRY